MNDKKTGYGNYHKKQRMLSNITRNETIEDYVGGCTNGMW